MKKPSIISDGLLCCISGKRLIIAVVVAAAVAVGFRMSPAVGDFIVRVNDLGLAIPAGRIEDFLFGRVDQAASLLDYDLEFLPLVLGAATVFERIVCQIGEEVARINEQLRALLDFGEFDRVGAHLVSEGNIAVDFVESINAAPKEQAIESDFDFHLLENPDGPGQRDKVRRMAEDDRIGERIVMVDGDIDRRQSFQPSGRFAVEQKAVGRQIDFFLPDAADEFAQVRMK